MQGQFGRRASFVTLRQTPGKISRTLTLLLRAERLIAARRVAVFRRQTGFMVFAGLFVAVALVMTNVAAYQGLATVMPTAWAALFVALGNLVLAGVMAFVASRMSSEHELSSAIEMRDMAYEELEHEVDQLVEEFRGTAHDVRVFARDPFGAILPGVMGPILSTLLALLSGLGSKSAGHGAPEETGPAADAGTGGLQPASPPYPKTDDPDAPFPEDPANPPTA